MHMWDMNVVAVRNVDVVAVRNVEMMAMVPMVPVWMVTMPTGFTFGTCVSLHESLGRVI